MITAIKDMMKEDIKNTITTIKEGINELSQSRTCLFYNILPLLVVARRGVALVKCI